MTDQPEDDPLKALKDYDAKLPQAEQDKALDDPHELFEMIERGDAVGVFIAVKNGADVEITDKNGMTPLHHAAANDMPLIAEALNQESNQAMWIKDKFGRLPDEIAPLVPRALIISQIARSTRNKPRIIDNQLTEQIENGRSR